MVEQVALSREEALLQTAPYAGFSAANEALQALSAVATQG